jgi:hypothetical protein
MGLSRIAVGALIACFIIAGYALPDTKYAAERSLAGFFFVSAFHYISFFPSDLNGPFWSISLEVICYALLPLLLLPAWRLIPDRDPVRTHKYLVWVMIGLQLAHFAIVALFPTDAFEKGWQYGNIGGAKEWLPHRNPATFMTMFMLGSYASFAIARRRREPRAIVAEEFERPGKWALLWALLVCFFLGSGGEINFYTGGNTSGATLVHAAKFTGAGNLVLNKTLQATALTQNAQIGYSNYVDTGANLHVSGNSSKAMVLQGTQFGTNNTLEVQLGGGNSVVAGITYQGNWWIGTPTTNNGTTRLIVSPRQTTDVGLMVAGIASQTGPLFALGGRSSTTDNVAMGFIDAAWSVSTHASRLADIVLSTTGYNGTHEAIRFSDTGSIAQPIIPIANIRDAADDAAAAALSPAVPVGGLYRTGSLLKIRVS